MVVGAGDLAQEGGRVDDAEVERAESAQAHYAEVFVAHHDGVGGAPFVAGEEAGGDVVDVGLEGRLEAVFPALDAGEHRDVFGRQRVFAGAESVAELAEVDELHHLALAHDELGPVFDGLVFVRITPRQGVARVVVELDDLEKLVFDESEDVHGSLPFERSMDVGFVR